MKKKLLRRLGLVSAALLFLFVTACGSGSGGDSGSGGNEDNSPKSGTINLSIKFEEKDIEKVLVKASWEDGESDSLNCKWECGLKDLPPNKPINITVSGKDKDDIEICEGSSEVSLKSGETKELTIFLYPKKDPYPHLLGSISAPESIFIGESASIRIEMVNDNDDSVTVSMTSSLNGSFSPESAVIGPSDDSYPEFTTIYTAGSDPGMDTISITITDAEGVVSTNSTDIEVKEKIDNTGNVNGAINLPPDVTAIKGEETSANTILTATVTDLDGDPSTVTYKWFIDGALVTETTNPVTVPTPAIGTEIKVEITDFDGASRSYSVFWGNN